AVNNEEDRISKLPDEIIHEILARLTSSDQSSELAILSKRWAHLGHSYPIFHFNSCNWRRPETKHKLNRFLAAAREKYSDIQHVAAAVRITLEDDLRDPQFVDELLGFLTEFTTQEIRLHCVTDNYPIQIPNGLFNGVIFRRLIVVKLRSCRFPSDSSSSLRFGAFLRVLSLKHVIFREDRILNSMIQAASSTLQSLTLSCLIGIRRIQVGDLPNLKALKASSIFCDDFEITRAQSLEILHVHLPYWRKGRIRVHSLVPIKVRVLHISGTDRITNDELNEFISKFPSLELLKLIDLPLIPELKINANNHKLLRAIWVKHSASLSSSPKVIRIDAPMLTNFIFERLDGLEFPSLLINNETTPAVQVSVCCGTLCQRVWHKLKQFLVELSEFQLTLELKPCQGKSTWINTGYGDDDDELHFLMIEHVKLSLKLLSLCGDVDVFVIDLFRYCRPKVVSFVGTGDEVTKKYIIHLKNMFMHFMRGFGRRHCQLGECRNLHKQLKDLKVMKRVMNNEEVELNTSKDLILFLDDPKRCRIVLDWH
ncbi:hypothetical protein LINPERHAP2_LOCUS32387, partial [Linum perenne]